VPTFEDGEVSNRIFCFRVPFKMSSRSLLDLPKSVHDLDKVPHVWLASADPNEPLRDADRIVIRGEGYDTEEAARSAGDRWRDIVCRGLARLHLGADFGERRPHSVLTEAGEQQYSQSLGHPVLSETPGVTTFLCQPAPRFLRMDVEGCRRPSPQQCAAVFFAAADRPEPLVQSERLAFDLYSGSFFETSADARLLMLTMAVETLLDPKERSQAVREHVQRLIQLTDDAPLESSEVASIRGSLTWLLDESIGQAGRRLARTLEPRRYSGLAPGAFFTKCYGVRSALVHGHAPRPERDEVDLLAADLELFVGHLLSGALLASFPD
jgi:hypothetical protein